MARTEFPIALDAVTRREVHIDEMFNVTVERPNFVCVECGQEMVPHLRTERTPGFVHRRPNTSCVARSRSAGGHKRQSAEPDPATFGLTPPPLPPEALPPLTRVTPPTARSWALLASVPRTLPTVEAVLQDEHCCVGDVYFRRWRCLQLLALYRPDAATPPGTAGGVLTLYTRSADEDRFAQNGREVGRWDLGPTRREVLEAFEAELKRLKGRLPDAVEVAAHAPFRRAPKGLRPNAFPFPEPLRGAGWTLL